MPFDGIVTSNIVYDLNRKITNGKIEKIYQPEPDEIVLHIHAGSAQNKLLISSGSTCARVHLISKSIPNPQNPPNFCMLLRKHIQGGRISAVRQVDSERIIEFYIDTFSEFGARSVKKLIAEIMGKHSNIILTDAENNKIIDSIKKISGDINRYRQILPGKEYIPPPGHGKISYFNNISPDTFGQIIRNHPGKLSDALVSGIQGISPFIASAICADADLDDTCNTAALSENNLNRLYKHFDFYVSKVSRGEFSPCVYENDSGFPADFYSYALKASVCRNEIYFEDISSAAEYYYSRKNSASRVKQRSSDLYRTVSSLLDKCCLKKQKLAEDIMQAASADHYRLCGELILANIHKIAHGINSVNIENYYTGKQIVIELDPRLSPSDNAQKYYKRYAKARTALKEKNIQLEETEKEILYLESVLISIENAQTSDDIEAIRQELIAGNYIRKKKPDMKNKNIESKPFSYVSSEGFKILAGRNNRQNDMLTFKTASNKDLWLHTKDIPGSHVIVQTEGKKVPEKTIAEAASIAAYYSKGRMSENVPVDYTYVKYVKKPPGAKPGMVIFSNNKTICANPALPD